MARSRSDALPRIMSPPTLPHPNPSADTRSPVLPSSRYSMRSSLSREPARRRADPEALEGLARVRRPRGQLLPRRGATRRAGERDNSTDAEPIGVTTGGRSRRGPQRAEPVGETPPPSHRALLRRCARGPGSAVPPRSWARVREVAPSAHHVDDVLGLVTADEPVRQSVGMSGKAEVIEGEPPHPGQTVTGLRVHRGGMVKAVSRVTPNGPPRRGGRPRS